MRTTRRGVHRILGIVAVLVTLSAIAVPAASADPGDPVEARLRRIERDVHRHHARIERTHARLRTVARRTRIAAHRARHRAVLARRIARRTTSTRSLTDRVRLAERRRGALRREAARLRRGLTRDRRAMDRLRSAERSATRLLWRRRPIGVCPVRGAGAISDDFGAARWDDGQHHAHQGNDITAPVGAPIVAPFDGVASASRSDLGGMTVRVTGASGYAANAHLSAYGTLGPVRAGTVVGYVGTTGNAQGSHDHFEWHPANGAAVDPYPYLNAVC